MIVTIDGPAGAGKSSAARALAKRLGFSLLDTGAMFRAVALAAQRAGIAWTDDAGLSQTMSSLRLEMPPGIVLLDGEDVSLAIRTPDISQGASIVAASAAVRPRLAELQRRIAAGIDIVCEGRDQGTVVFPEARCKFFLSADSEERLRRRADELEQRGNKIDRDAMRRELAERDQRDASRDLAPLRPAADAVLIDSTRLTPMEVVACMEAEIRRKMGG